ncbi:HNH endonuclease [Candidatus Saccharibacteria bacterium]|nr:HNH endonuclease [Candidatus Saccharibacteria bacterium]
MAKSFARKFYSSKAWQDCRNEYAKRQHHLCENCLRRGIYKPGVIVHHKIEIDPVTIERPEIALNFNNLELLCRDCHAEAHDLTGGRWTKINQKKREERDKRRRFSIDENGKVFSR